MEGKDNHAFEGNETIPQQESRDTKPDSGLVGNSATAEAEEGEEKSKVDEETVKEETDKQHQRKDLQSKPLEDQGIESNSTSNVEPSPDQQHQQPTDSDPNKSYGTFQENKDETDFFSAVATNQFEFLSNSDPTKNQRKTKSKSKSSDEDPLEDESSDYSDDLTQWKDRTQAAATTSLSLVQVALLRDVINGGEDTYRHYMATVTILAICIILEIISGFLIITLYMLKSRAQALTNLDSLQVGRQQQGQDQTDGGHFEVENDIEQNLTASGQIIRNIYGLDLGCCGCSKPGIEDILREAIRRKYLQELRLTLRYPHYNDLEDVRNDLDLLRKRRRIMQKFLTQVKMNSSFQIIIRLQSIITYIFFILSIFNIFVVIFGVSRESGRIN